VDDPLLVSSLQRLGDLRRDRKGLLQRDRALGDPVGEGRALDQLQDEGRLTGGLLEP